MCPLVASSLLVRSHPRASGTSSQVLPEQSSPLGRSLCTITIVTKIKVGRLSPRGHSANTSRLFLLVLLIIRVFRVPKKGNAADHRFDMSAGGGRGGDIRSQLLTPLVRDNQASNLSWGTSNIR